jgi:hypothetical protein
MRRPELVAPSHGSGMIPLDVDDRRRNRDESTVAAGCGNWQEGCQRLHSDILSGCELPRYAVAG